MTRFKAPVEYNRTSDSDRNSMGRFAGMPVGVQMLSDWHIQRLGFQVVADLPVTTVSWTITLVGVGTVALSDDLFPPHVTLTNAAADNDSVELQWTAADASGEWIDLTTDRACYFETMIRLRDAGNVDAAVEEVEFFVGLCVTDATAQAGATDFVGFRKRDLTDDATGRINFVCADAGGAAGALVDGLVQATGWVALNPVENQATDRANRVLGANQWIKLAFLIEPQAAGATGRAFCWVNDEPIPGNPIDLTGQIPNENICLTLAVQNGEAVIKNMDVAYVLLAQKYRDDADILI